MSVQPHELVSGRGRGVMLVGTLRCKEEKMINGKRVMECHLLTGTQPGDVVFIEAWTGQAEKVSSRSDGDVVKITNPNIKTLGEKAKYQASNIQVYISVAQATTIEKVPVSDIPKGMPIRHMPTCSLEMMNTLKKKVHQIATTGIVQDITMCTAASGPKHHIVLVDKVSARLSVWEDAARSIQTIKKGDVILASRLQASGGKEDTTELQTSKYTTFEVLTGANADVIKKRNPDPAAARTISYDYQIRTDYATVETEISNLANMQCILVPGLMRDIPIVYEVQHCLVRCFEPLGGNEFPYYMGCPECKKTCSEQCPTHNLPAEPMFLGSFSIADNYSEIAAKAIGDVCASVLNTKAKSAIPNAEGMTPQLDAALEKVMAVPMVMRFVVTKYPEKQRNQFELVHAKIAFDPDTGNAILALNALRVAPVSVPGVPPVTLESLQLRDDTILVMGSAVGSVQIFVSVVDKGTEAGCVEQDGNLARVTRTVMCCATGTTAKMRRTGTLNDMVPYMTLKEGTYLYAVVTPLEKVDDVWHVSLVACQIWDGTEKASLFHTYWMALLQHFQASSQKETLKIEKEWTPGRRIKRLRSGDGSCNDPTPVKMLTPSQMRFGESN